MGIANKFIRIVIRRSRKSHFFAGLLAGIAAAGDVYIVNNYRKSKSDVDSMRSDWERIGNDFRTVIDRENVKSAQN